MTTFFMLSVTPANSSRLCWLASTCQLPSTRSTSRRSLLGYVDRSESRAWHLIGSAATWPTGHNTSESARRGHRHLSVNMESPKVPSWGLSCSPFTSPQLLTLSRHSTLVTTSTLTTRSSTLHLTMTTLATPATYRHALQQSVAGSYSMVSASTPTNPKPSSLELHLLPDTVITL